MGVIDAIKGVFSRGAKAEVNLKTDKERYALGETIQCTVSVMPKANFSARESRVEFVAVERVTMVTSDGYDTQSNFTYKKRQIVQTNPSYSNGQMTTNKVKIKIPQNSTPTYKGEKAMHRWHLRFVVDIPLGIDIKTEKEILVEKHGSN